MTDKTIKEVGVLLEKLGKALQANPKLYQELEQLLESSESKDKTSKKTKSKDVDEDKLDQIDLLSLFDTEGPEHVDKLLADMSMKELKYLMKKHHFGVPPTKSIPKLKETILVKLKQKKTDAFRGE